MKLDETVQGKSHRLQVNRERRTASRMALRINQTEDQIQHGLIRQRNVRHQARNAERQGNNETLTVEECNALDDEGILTPITAITKKSLLNELSYALGPSGLDQCICVSCDRQRFRTTTHTYSTENA